MTGELLIESDRHQTRVALLEGARVVEIDIEQAGRRGLVGNIYKGRVSRVLPGIQAAFVEIGLERDGFLYAGDVESAREGLDGSEPAGEAAGGPSRAAGEPKPIESLVQTGQELLVQVIKDPLLNKGARLATQISLPGRHVVLLPRTPACGVSRRITETEERERLLALVEDLAPAGGGGIVRTAGEGKDLAALGREMARLKGFWQKARRLAEEAPAPALVHRELHLELRAVRDLAGETLESIRVSGREAYQRVEAYLSAIDPDLGARLRPCESSPTLFERYGVEREIETGLRRKVWLRSGGYIVVSPTEALVAIDVNTGRFVGAHSLEATVLQTNLEAAREIVHQIRLRNLGGILVIDFIDMVDPDHRHQVLETLEQELEKDRALSRVLGMSEFGLVEITRKRSRPSLEALLTQSCPSCDGRGRVRSAASTAIELCREIRRRHSGLTGRSVRLRLHPGALRELGDEERSWIEELAEPLSIELRLEGDVKLHPEEFEIVADEAGESELGVDNPPGRRS